MKAALNSTRRALRFGTGLATCVSCIVFAQAAFGQSMPVLANNGGATVGPAVGTVLTVDALGADRVINWNSFSIGQGNTVNFVSTNAGPPAPVTVINRVIGTTMGATTTFSPSRIDGTLTSADHIALWLVNPSGIVFGQKGSFSGGSLVLSTLDFLDGTTGSQVFSAVDKTTRLRSRDVVTDMMADPDAFKLDFVGVGPGAIGKIVSTGSVLLLGEQITVGKTLTADGSAFIVAASDARVTTRAGSPVNYKIEAGTRLTGATVLASGVVEGRSIVVAASNGTDTLKNLLQVDAGGDLTATAADGSITLLTTSNPVSGVMTAAGAGMDLRGTLSTTGTAADISIKSNASVRADRVIATGDVLVKSGLGTADTLTAGTVRAGGNIQLLSTGNMALGTDTGQRIMAGGTVSIKSGAAIGRGSALATPIGTASDTLSILSFNDTTLANGGLSISAQGNINLGNARLEAGVGGLAAITLTSTAGGITLGAADARKFTANALTTFTSTGTIAANNAANGPGAAIAINADGNVTLAAARTTGADQDIVIKSLGAVEAVTLSASRNLTVSSVAEPAASLTATTLEAQTGSISASAGSMSIGNANAGLAVSLRSDGNINFTGNLTAGASQPSGNVVVSGLTSNSAAAQFNAGTVTATTGRINVQADTQTLARAVSAESTTLTGTGAVSLGSANVGTDLVVTSVNDTITLGSTGPKTISANGKVTVTSTAGAIRSGNGPDILTVIANADNDAGAEALTIKAQNSVNLGNASLFGGDTATAPILVQSTTANVAIGSANGSRFTGKANTTFAASRAIAANSATALPGATISITGLTGITMTSATTGGTGENIVLTSDGPISATTIKALNNLTIASSANPALSISANALEAVNGSLNAFAQSMNLGTVEAGNSSVSLRASGAINVTGSVSAASNVSVSGLVTPNAGSFTTPLAEAINGNVSIKAGATDIGTARAGADISVEGNTAILGSVSAGRMSPLGKYTVVTDGLITLGKAENQTQSATGGISITSTNGAIGEGATGLTLTANRDGAGTEALTLKAGNAIALGGATLNGGADQQSDILLRSGTAAVANTAINKANSANFTAESSGAFTANGPILAVGNALITAGTDVALNNVTASGADHDIKITAPGAVSAATLMAARNVTIAGPTNSNAASFSANTVKATAGTISVKAGATDIGLAESGIDTKIVGNTAILGTVTAGKSSPNGNFTVATDGLVTLGKAANQTQSATGVITIESRSGSIVEGDTGLKLVANSDGLGTEALKLKAGAAISLGNATLNGGSNKQSDVALTSVTDTTIGKANSADFTANSGGAFTANDAITAAGNAAITAAGAVSLMNVTASGTDHDITIKTPGAISAESLLAARNVTVAGGATSFTAPSVEATSGTIDIAASATDIGTARSGSNIKVTGDVATLGSVTAGTTLATGKFTVLASGNVTLGKAANQSQSAAGGISIESTNGTIEQGAAGLMLTANRDGVNAEELSLKAGNAISLASATLNGGLAQQSDVTLRSGTGTFIARANAAAFTANAGQVFATNGPVSAAGNVSITAGGAVSLKDVTATGAAHNISIAAPNTVTAESLSAQGNVTVGGGATAFTAQIVKAIDGSIDVKANATDIAEARSGIDTRITGDTANLGTIAAGTGSPSGAITVVATGDVTLGKLARQTQSASGAVSITSTTGSIQQGASGLVLTANSNGLGTEALTLKAAKAILLEGATLNGGSNQQSDVSLTSGTDTRIANANGARIIAKATRDLTVLEGLDAKSTISLTSTRDMTIGSAKAASVKLVAGRDFASNGAITATGDVSITATGKLKTAAAVVAGDNVSLSANDATIGADITAKTIDVTNSGSGTLLIGGSAESVTGTFALSSAEAGRLNAKDTLTLGADGSDNVEIRQVEFSVPKTVRVLATGKRIDVTGRISFDSNTTLNLGGNVDSGQGNASIIQIASDSGGSIDGADGRLELGANNIIVGNKALIGRIEAAGSPSAQIDEAMRMNLQLGSPLYEGGASQAILVRAGTMKINFTGFALFQNTGISELGQGVSLGSVGKTGVVLDLASPSTQPVFALFGSVNGLVNNAVALLGNPPLDHYSNIVSSRLNGCVIGGGNCLSVQNLTPALSGLENVRASIFTVKPDFQVPFDPLVGTNNDALFDDVGSFGLGELPMAPIECSDPISSCSTQKKDSK